VPYTPETWNAQQRELHEATSLDDALHHASCLAGGWYARPVTIDIHVTADGDEQYRMRPADVPPAPGWTPCYTITSEAQR